LRCCVIATYTHLVVHAVSSYEWYALLCESMVGSDHMGGRPFRKPLNRWRTKRFQYGSAAEQKTILYVTLYHPSEYDAYYTILVVLELRSSRMTHYNLCNHTSRRAASLISSTSSAPILRRSRILGFWLIVRFLRSLHSLPSLGTLDNLPQSL
jgi:hypothetical protein